MPMNEHFGEHLMIDGYGGSFEKMWDKDLVFKTVDELPAKQGMTKLSETVLKECIGNDIKDPGGLSAYVMINESHISVHTFPTKGFVSIDFYTCRNGINVDEVTNYFKTAFDLKDVEINFVKRGTHYPEGNLYDPKTGAPLS